MDIKKAEFTISSAKLSQCPKDDKAELAFIDLINNLEIDYSSLSKKHQREIFNYTKEQIIFKYQQMKGE